MPRKMFERPSRVRQGEKPPSSRTSANSSKSIPRAASCPPTRSFSSTSVLPYPRRQGTSIRNPFLWRLAITPLQASGASGKPWRRIRGSPCGSPYSKYSMRSVEVMQNFEGGVFMAVGCSPNAEWCRPVFSEIRAICIALGRLTSRCHFSGNRVNQDLAKKLRNTCVARRALRWLPFVGSGKNRQMP
jgi:hypothetical protein